MTTHDSLDSNDPGKSSPSGAEQMLAEGMARLFEIDAAQLTPDVRLYEDLDIDSIDAVNLIIEFRRVSGVPVPPERFREARTVGDVLAVLQDILRS